MNQRTKSTRAQSMKNIFGSILSFLILSLLGTSHAVAYSFQFVNSDNCTSPLILYHYHVSWCWGDDVGWFPSYGMCSSPFPLGPHSTGALCVPTECSPGGQLVDGVRIEWVDAD